MKKYIFPIITLSIFVLVSCNRELEKTEIVEQTSRSEIESPEVFSIKAYIDDTDVASKTEYTDETDHYSFTWKSGDVIAVQIFNGTVPNQIKFSANSDGASSNFNQIGSTFDLTTTHQAEGYSNKTYTLGDYAFYPKERGENTFEYVPNGSAIDNYVKLKETVDYYTGAQGPMSIIPLLGKKQSGDGTPTATYQFRTASGVLKLTLNNLPAAANKIKVTSKNSEDVLSGEWYVNDDLFESGTIMTGSNVKAHSHTKTVTFSNSTTSNVDFYIPIPAGTIHGFTLEVYSYDTVIYTKSTSKDIEIVRARVTEIPALSLNVPEWFSIGTAKFKDVKTWEEESYTAFISVPIERNRENADKYRLDNPYGLLFTALSKEPALEPTRYLEFKLTKKDDAVKWEWNNNPSFTAYTSNEVAFNYATASSDGTGQTYTGHSATSRFVHPGWTTAGESDLVKKNNHVRNRVIAYQNNGMPAFVRLRPKYRNDGNTGWLTCDDTRSILIVFPNCESYVDLDKINFTNVTITNYQSTEGATEYINDDNVDHYWHSYYSNGTYTSDETYGTTIDIDLSTGASVTGVTKIVLNCLMRTDKKDTNGMPAQIKVAGKTSGSDTWTLLTTKDFKTTDLGGAYWLSIPILSGTTQYEKIRVGIVSVYYGGNKYLLTSPTYVMFTHMAELELYGK